MFRNHECQSRNKSFGFHKCDFDEYNIKRKNWYHSIDEYTFTLSSQTLNDIDYIFEMFNFPTFPTLIEKHQQLPYRRAVCENYVQLSPPRRQRRRIELDEQANNCEHAMPGHLCNEVNSIV